MQDWEFLLNEQIYILDNLESEIQSITIGGFLALLIQIAQINFESAV